MSKNSPLLNIGASHTTGPITENRSIQGVHQIRRFSFLKMEAEPASKTYCFLDDGQSEKKKDYVSESCFVK